MTKADQHTGQEVDFISRFSESFTNLMLEMFKVDDWCIQAAQDITKQELVLIGYIGSETNVIMRDIATFLNTPFSTATGIVDKLVQKGYLKRFYSEDDRRVVLVCLSKKKGLDLYKLMNEKKRETSEYVMNTLNKQEQGQLIELLDKVSSKISQPS